MEYGIHIYTRLYMCKHKIGLVTNDNTHLHIRTNLCLVIMITHVILCWMCLHHNHMGVEHVIAPVPGILVPVIVLAAELDLPVHLVCNLDIDQR